MPGLRSGTESSYYSPCHIHSISQDVPFGGIARAVVAEHAGRILADQEIVLPVAVVITAADDEPVIGGKLAAFLKGRTLHAVGGRRRPARSSD